MRVYMRPKTSETHITLQATTESWQEALAVLKQKGLSRYSMFIEPNIRNQEGTVFITLPNETARAIVRALGMSA